MIKRQQVKNITSMKPMQTPQYDAFAQVPKTVDEDGIIVYEHINGDGGNVRGVELDLGIRRADPTRSWMWA